MSAQFPSTAARYPYLRASWLAMHVRPCNCDGDGPLDLRERTTGQLECSSCGRSWKARADASLSGDLDALIGTVAGEVIDMDDKGDTESGNEMHALLEKLFALRDARRQAGHP